MNRGYLLIICIIIAIIYVCIIKAIEKEKLNKIREKNSNFLNKKDATLVEIQEAYEYETGKKYKNLKKHNGELLEYEVFKILYRLGGKVLSDLYIEKPKDKKSTHQTDLIFINNTGIYVIEAKHTTWDLLVGNDESSTWKKISYNGDYDEIYNPLKQNMKHIETLKIFLKDYDYLNIYYKSIVVIGMEKEKIKVQYNKNKYDIEQDIVSINDLEIYMEEILYERKEIIIQKGELLDDSLVLEIYNKIHEKCSDVDENIKIKHALDNNY